VGLLVLRSNTHQRYSQAAHSNPLAACTCPLFAQTCLQQLHKASLSRTLLPSLLTKTRSKIKCRGEKPCCSSCLRRNIDCVYESPTSEAHLPNATPTCSDKLDYYVDDFAQYEGAQPCAAFGKDTSKDLAYVNSHALYNENVFDLNLDWIFSTDSVPESNPVN
jgi:hypothetical protein